MDVRITLERARNVINELLAVIRSSEIRREIVEQENMRLREENRRLLQSQVRELRQCNEIPETCVVYDNPDENGPRSAAIRPLPPL